MVPSKEGKNRQNYPIAYVVVNTNNIRFRVILLSLNIRGNDQNLCKNISVEPMFIPDNCIIFYWEEHCDFVKVWQRNNAFFSLLTLNETRKTQKDNQQDSKHVFSLRSS